MTIAIFIFVQLILLLSFLLVPYMSKKDVAFGVKIPTSAAKSPEILRIRKRYTLFALIVGLTLVASQFISINEYYFMATMGLAIVLYFIIYLYAYKQMINIKKSSHWPVNNTTVIDTDFRQKQLTLNPKWYLLYLLIFLATIGTAISQYSALPDVLRTQTNATGEVTATMAKDQAIFSLLGIQAFVLLLMVLIQIIIKKAKQDVSAKNTRSSVNNSVKFRYVTSVILYVLGLVVGVIYFTTMLFTLGIIEDARQITWMTLVMTFIPVIILLIMAVKYGQDGSKLAEETSDTIEKDDDRFWKLGVFYYNPNDPAVFVSKRVGMGWTVNHARWQAWVMYLAIIGFIVAAIVFSGGL